MQTATENNQVKPINLTEVNQVMATNGGAKLVDVRDRAQYEQEHIKGSISLPLAEIRELAKEQLAKEETIITYCEGLECPASTDAAKILLSLGYKFVLDYKGGLEDYKKAQLPLEGTLYGAN